MHSSPTIVVMGMWAHNLMYMSAPPLMYYDQCRAVFDRGVTRILCITYNGCKTGSQLSLPLIWIVIAIETYCHENTNLSLTTRRMGSPPTTFLDDCFSMTFTQSVWSAKWFRRRVVSVFKLLTTRWWLTIRATTNITANAGYRLQYRLHLRYSCIIRTAIDRVVTNSRIEARHIGFCDKKSAWSSPFNFLIITPPSGREFVACRLIVCVFDGLLFVSLSVSFSACLPAILQKR